MGALQEDTALSGADGRYAATLSPDWNIFGPNGGYLSAIVLRAIGEVAPPGHRPCTFSAQYLAPAQPTSVDVAVDVRRRGRNAWCLSADLRQGDRHILQAQAWTTDKEDGPTYAAYRAPPAPPPAEVEPLADASTGLFAAMYRNSFERRPIRDVESEPTPRLLRWMRYKAFDAGGNLFLDAARSLILADTLVFPAFCGGQAGPVEYVATSLDITMAFHTASIDRDWLLFDTRAEVAARGLIFGTTTVWDEDGALIASGTSQMLHVSMARS